MKRFWLFVNTEKPQAERVAKDIRAQLFAMGAYSVEITGSVLGEEIAGATDCVISLGGDGTIIRASHCIAGSGIPIVGVNLGHMGYLTAVSQENEIPGMLTALLGGDFKIEERMMLEGCIVPAGEKESVEGSPLRALPGEAAERRRLALNEIVVSRKTNAGPAHFRVSANGVFLNEYKADGIIISTPTGSTAYNLSAGGPIVDPVARMKILTPICPHALNRSSIVLKAEDRLDIEIPGEEGGVQSVSYDGAVVEELFAGNTVRVVESELTTRLIRLNGDTFLTQLRRKMSAL